MRTKLLPGLSFAAMSLLPACGAYAATMYRVIDLGDPEGGRISQGTSNTGTCDLGGRVAGDLTEALGVNDWNQVVGASLVSGHAFLWQNGKMSDLNSLVVPGTTALVLTDAQDINDLGEITGMAKDPSTGASVAFEAVPVL